MNNLEDLKIMLSNLEVELIKFYTKGNETASIRARKILQDIKGQAQIIRMDISNVRKIRNVEKNKKKLEKKLKLENK